MLFFITDLSWSFILYSKFLVQEIVFYLIIASLAFFGGRTYTLATLGVLNLSSKSLIFCFSISVFLALCFELFLPLDLPGHSFTQLIMYSVLTMCKTVLLVLDADSTSAVSTREKVPTLKVLIFQWRFKKKVYVHRLRVMW